MDHDLKLIKKYITCINTFNKPRYQDITPMFNDSVPFLVSGEMLMVTALTDENYNHLLGGQSLHFIYICERILNVFKKNNGSFQIVFFDIWENILHWQMLLFRQILIKHFENNTEIVVHHFTNVYDPGFSLLIDNVRPAFFLYNLDYSQLMKFLGKFSVESFLGLFCAEFTFCLKSDLPVVDLTFLNVDISMVKGHLLENDVHYTKLPNYREDVLRIQANRQGLKVKKIPIVYHCNEIREFLVCNAVCAFLNKYPKQENDVKLFVLYVVVMENLNLENRGCPILQTTNSSKIKDNIRIWYMIILSLLKHINHSKKNWKNICDLWQGTLLAVVYHSITEPINSESLGVLAEFYEKYFKKINSVVTKEINPYPIKPYGSQFCTFKMPYCRKMDEIPLEVVNAPIVKRFCDELIGHVTWADPKSVLLNEKCYFDEVRHWHSRKPITDDCDHVKGDDRFDERNATESQIYWYHKNKALQARWNNYYGINLIGSDQIYETILCQQGSKSVSVVKHKESNKTKQIKAEINEAKGEKARKMDKEKFSSLKMHCKAASDLDQLNRAIKEVELFEKKITTTEIILECLVLKASILDKICTKLMKSKGNVPESNIEKLFLTIRDLLTIYHPRGALSPHQQKKVSKILYGLGFSSIVEYNNLPSSKIDGDPYNKENWISFQLKQLGPVLEREIEGVYDEDVRFIPDPWQKQFISAIRKNQSALVVAPTSSGKTFASYYCMKRVLQTSKDGIVVYVSPTKALVNQVAATITVKLRNAPSSPGISTVGVFTRDYRTNALNSRILVTVPQCLEILLLSPRRYTWSKKIKYVIFDEVHCLKGVTDGTTGITWERCILMVRCPFLALSATIRNPESFHNWLASTERFKEQQDIANGFERWYDSTVNLVVHTDRHSDLIKYTYLQGKGLQHCHPYSFLDHEILNMYQGIPDGTNLSSLEVLQLYDAIKANAPEYITGDNEIEAFFARHSKNGFITHNNVKNFERVLSEIFVEIYKTNFECYQKIHNHLQPIHDVTYDDVGFAYSKENMMNLLTALYKKNMLPALIFSYNRSYIEHFTKQTTQKLESLAVKDIDRREAKKLEKLEKKERKELHKLEAKGGEEGSSYKQAHKSASLNILEETSSFLKGVGIIDKDDIQFIENRLAKKRDGYYGPMLISALKQGLGFHHAGLNNTYRSTIEMLFRIGILKVVFATGTLAMGIHMPCKTVVICCDSPYMNSLEYHQMAGRAGRRGFDNEGNVVFIGINKRRQKTLLTSRLPVIDGNFPLTITFILRLLTLVTKVTDLNEQTEECLTKTLSSALTVLENSLSYQKFPFLRRQMKHFFCFGTQLLYLQNLISLDGLPLKLSSIITHLHYHEPANFAFVYILQNGAIRKMIEDNRGDDYTIQWNLIVILNFLFARLLLHPTQKEKEYKNSRVVLDPLPEVIKESLIQYNEKVKFVFDAYFASMNTYCTKNFGPDNKLPLSRLRFETKKSLDDDNIGDVLHKIREHCKTRSICSTFCSLSSHGDNGLYSERNLISNIRDDICPDVKIVPIIDLDVEINSYAADFYNHGILQAIVHDNGLKHGQEFQLLKDFSLVLKTIVLALEELEPIKENDIVLHHFRVILSKFQGNYNEVFNK